MAKPTENGKGNRDSNRRPYNARPTPSVLASCYTVSASTMALKGFHYSSTGAGGTSFPHHAHCRHSGPTLLLEANFNRQLRR